MIRRKAYPVCFATSSRAVVLPELRRNELPALTRGTKGPLSDAIQELIRKGWNVEHLNGTKVKITGPDGQGPVFSPIRVYGRGVENFKSALRREGFVFESDEPGHKKNVEEEEEMSAPQLHSVAAPADTTLPAPVEQMLDALRRTIGNELAAAESLQEVEEWQRLYEEEQQKVQRLEQVNGELVKRCEAAESKLNTLKSLFRD